MQDHNRVSLWAERYLFALLVGTVVVELLVFVRTREWGLSDISVWYFAFGFVVTIFDRAWGLIGCVIVLAVGSSLHMQLNELFGTETKALLYPGVDSCIGFLAACLVSRRHWEHLFRPSVERRAGILIVLLHLWVVLSTVIAVARNLWQSSSEFSLRGLYVNLGLVRGISFHDDYFPLQDLFFLSAALLVLMTTWSLLIQRGARLAAYLAFGVLFGASVNGAFAVWQKLTGLGWAHYPTSLSLNAFLPDLHSFAALMAVGVMLAIGLLTTNARGAAVRAAVLLALASCGAGLFLSNSRSILFLVLASLGVLFFRALYAKKNGVRVLAFGGVVAVALALHAILSHGYRGLSYVSLAEAFETFSATELGVVLSHRPEIWSAAVRMYAQTPLFGLGQGQFYRLSSIEGFSGSPFLAQSGGENAHNYFLQTAVELGPVAWILIAAILLVAAKAGRARGRSFALYGLAGIVLGNLFAHALLIREMLVISVLLLGIHFWHIEHGTAGVAARSTAEPVNKNYLIWLAVVVVAALADSAISFQQFPFNYGQRCHEERPLWEDGWASGLYSQAIPEEARSAHIHVQWARPDVESRKVDLEVSILASDGSLLQRKEHRAVRMGDGPPLLFDLTSLAGTARVMTLKTSNCFTPLNAGLAYDPRRLGVRIESLRFYDERGTSLTLGE